MKQSKKSSLSDRNIEKKFTNVENTMDGIQGMTVWAIHHREHAGRIVDAWTKIFHKSATQHTLTLMYCCNDIVQNCKRKNATVYKELFKQQLPEAISQLSQTEKLIPPVKRIFSIWSERLVFPDEVISDLQECLITDDVREKMQQEEIDKKLLTEFKPNKVVESLRGFRRLELDADMKSRQIANIRLDISNSDAVKQLKDRDHGSEYTKQFEDHSVRLSEYSGELIKVMQERSALIELLELTQHFYELQYGEAVVVANAYKNFGLRVSKQKKQLDELMLRFPDSPIPSPSMDAPSPTGSTTPPDLSLMPSQITDMDMSDDERGDTAEVVEDAYSPPGSLASAPSPEGSPLGVSFSPDASKEDLDIVRGVIPQYDPTGDYDLPNPDATVYNPKIHLDPRQRQNDVTARLQNLVQLRRVDNNGNSGDGTPTQDEYNDSRKRSANSSDDEYDPTKESSTQGGEDDMQWLAWQALEETMVTPTPPKVRKPALLSPPPPSQGGYNRGLAMSLGILSQQLNQKSKHPNSAAPVPVGVPPPATNSYTPTSKKSVPSPVPMPVLDAGMVAAELGSLPNSNLTTIRTTDQPDQSADSIEDANAKAQREFLARIQSKGPFKASRYLQKLNEDNAKIKKQDSVKRSDSTISNISTISSVTSEPEYQPLPVMDPGIQNLVPVQSVQSLQNVQSVQGVHAPEPRPKVEYRIGGVISRPPLQLQTPATTYNSRSPAKVEPPSYEPSTPSGMPAYSPPGGAPYTPTAPSYTPTPTAPSYTPTPTGELYTPPPSSVELYTPTKPNLSSPPPFPAVRNSGYNRPSEPYMDLPPDFMENSGSWNEGPPPRPRPGPDQDQHLHSNHGNRNNHGNHSNHGNHNSHGNHGNPRFSSAVRFSVRAPPPGPVPPPNPPPPPANMADFHPFGGRSTRFDGPRSVPPTPPPNWRNGPPPHPPRGPPPNAFFERLNRPRF